MALINASLLAGAILAALPVLLHLLMRAKPKRIEFPALQLLRMRQTTNSRRMRLRHVLLLLLRAFLILVAVLAVARPSLPAAHYGLQWYEWTLLLSVVVAAALTYLRLAGKIAGSEHADHRRRERIGRLRAGVLLTTLVALLLVVGVPWGLRVRAEATEPANPMAEDAPVAAVFLFDTSLSMNYRHESRTRLEQATEIAAQHLSVLTNGSRVAVATTDPASDVIFQADLAGVRSRIDDLETSAVNRTLNTILRDAVNAQVTDRERVMSEMAMNDAFAREVYVFSDLSEAAWDDPDEAGLHDLLVQHDWLQIYLIDVSVPEPINLTLSDVKLDREVTSVGQSVHASLTLTATGNMPTSVPLEVYTIDAEGNEIAGGGGAARRMIQMTSPSQQVNLSISAADRGRFQRGFVRLGIPDPLPSDDMAYFCFGVSSVPKVLLVSDRLVDSRYLMNALQPEFLERLGIRRYDCHAVTVAGFQSQNLADFDAVCLVNWHRPEARVWSDLLRFVEGGGSLLVTMGGERNIQPETWRTPEASRLLPALPVLKVPFRPEPASLTITAADHRIGQAFENAQDAMTELSRALFDQCWAVDVSAEARTIMTYNDRTQRPALMERHVGQGRVLMFTSAVDNLRNGGALWNEGFVIDNWAWLMFADECLQFLLGADAERHNFVVGRPVEIPVPASQRFRQYAVARPRFRLTEGTLGVDESSVLLTDIDTPGQYQVRAADDTSSFRTEFAANVDGAEFRLKPAEAETLDMILGQDRYAVVTDPAQLERAVSRGRLGVEVSPVFLALLIFLLCGEHLMANFFYDEPAEAPEPVGGRVAGGT